MSKKHWKNWYFMTILCLAVMMDAENCRCFLERVLEILD